MECKIKGHSIYTNDTGLELHPNLSTQKDWGVKSNGPTNKAFNFTFALQV